jgi:O-antigen ligase
VWSELDPVRWTIYLTLGPVALFIFFLLRSHYLRALILLGVLIFVDGVFLSWRAFYMFSFSLSSAVAYTLFASLLLTAGGRTRMPELNAAWIAFMAFALIGAVIGASGPGVPFRLMIPDLQFFFFEALLYFWIGRCVFRDGAEVHRALTWLALFAGAVAVLHLFSLMTGYTFYAAARKGGEIAAESGGFRYGSVFRNPNYLASFYAMMLPAALVLRLGWARPGRLASLGVLVAMGLMAVSLPLTASRGGVLATLVSVALALLLLPLGLRQGISLVGAGLGITAIAFVGLALILPEFSAMAMDRFGRGLQDVRLSLWPATLKTLLANPLGVGLHYLNFENALSRFGFGHSTPHNIYLAIACKTGIPGLLAFLALCLGVIRRVRIAQRFGDPQVRTAATAILAMLVGFLAGGLTQPQYFAGYKLHHLFWFLAGAGSFLPRWVDTDSMQRRAAVFGSDDGDSALQPSRASAS